MSNFFEQLLESVTQQPLLVFGIVAVALIIAVIMARRARKRQLAAEEIATFEPAPEEAADGLPRRTRKDERTPLGCIIGPGLFLLAGLGFLAIFAFPAAKVVKAQSWEAMDCEILASSVGSHSSDDGYTYSVDVTYRYTFDGVEYTGSRYKFLGGSSSGREGKQKVVDALPPGHITTCWVDPKDPTESVLNRGLSWEYAFAILPLVFIAVGAVGLVVALRARLFSKSPAVSAEEGIQAAVAPFGGTDKDGLPDPAPGEMVLEPELTPGGKLGCLIFVALFWNGIVGVFVWQLIEHRDLFLGCFLIPFVLVGLLLLIGIPYQILALANPRPQLRIADGRLRPGGSTTLYWSFSGAARRLRTLKIELEGREKVSYRSGDSNSSSTATFARVPLVDIQRRDLVVQGNARIEIPAEAMHSFEANRNEIAWYVVLNGAIKHWPDVAAEFEIQVLPELAT